MPQLASSSSNKKRLLSIDALRGFDMFWILGAEGVFAALYLITGWGFLTVFAEQMQHTSWHGFTAYDLIFPLFIFLSGVSIGLAAKPMSAYSPIQGKQKLRHAHKRLALLVLLGIVYNHGWGGGMPASIDEIRFASVLGRIGLAWYVAVMLVWYTSIRSQWWVAIGLLLGYWLIQTTVTLGSYGGGDFSANGAINAWFDQTLLPGITYQNTLIDPEGLLSNLGSIVNALAGVFVGRHLIKYQQQPKKLLSHLVGSALILLLLAYGWGVVLPINKTLWSSSFVLLTCGYSILLLALFYWIIDVLNITRWAWVFAVIGTNSIVAYLGTSLIDWKFSANSLFGGVITAMPTQFQPLAHIVAILLIQWLILYWLYSRKIFIKV
ncbi:transmembrane glucosamine N-acetyltransferase NagX [Thalassotalea sp. PLHSN55]|uniref:transmembrane glucosamine N-acetyltransferase NagX n=1 Tax=Thalassotalea sp. PLHSN55 TaxID=3435888 RepID=UPI003F861456